MSIPGDVSPLLRGDRWSDALPSRAAKEPSMRAFGAVMLGGFGGLGLLDWLGWRKTGDDWRLALAGALWAVAGAVFLWSLVSPRTLPPVYRAWMRFGEALGAVTSTLMLSILYYLVVTPVGLLMRATGTDPLDRRGGRATYWKERPPRGDAESYRHLS
jgi:hypothetical protein